ncbi:MAG: hypothetical protein JXQ71_01715 [Verrucomicrobia bacterium]|nr:hypothetical protein [Verrucomicrobiota bacterium]
MNASDYSPPAGTRQSRRPTTPVCLPWILAGLAILPSAAQDDTPFTRLFDTRIASSQPRPQPSAAQPPHASLVAEEILDHAFTGDALLRNDTIAVVLRPRGPGADVFAITPAGWQHRALVRLAPIASLKIVENNAGTVALSATTPAPAQATLTFRLTAGEPMLEIQPGQGATFVHLESAARHVVVPDYFGDDMVITADDGSPQGQHRAMSAPDAPGAKALLCLPAENLLLNLLDGGDAILMAVWQSNEQDVWLTPPGGAPAGPTRSTHAEPRPPARKPPPSVSQRIRCRSGNRIWLALLEGRNLWHASVPRDSRPWQPPFPAKWRCSRPRANGVAESWDCQLMTTAAAGPLVVYPIDRAPATPLTVLCPTDVLRNTLGVGPCQYILACEGLSAQGDPTPHSVMTWIEQQFAAGKAQQASDDIRDRLARMRQHVAAAHANLRRYAAFAARLRQHLARHPHAGHTTPFLSILNDLDRCLAPGLAPSAAPEQARHWASHVAALIGQTNALPLCQHLASQLRSLGATQDRTLATSRMSTRRLRAQAQTILENAAPGTSLASEVRRLAEQMLQTQPKTAEPTGDPPS